MLRESSTEKAGVFVLGRIPDPREESALTSHFPQPLCNRPRVKPYTSADPERWCSTLRRWSSIADTVIKEMQIRKTTTHVFSLGRADAPLPR
jgi:hypothetical protein